MSLLKFNDEDIVRYSIKTYPKSEFFMYNTRIKYNDKANISGVLDSTIGMVPEGYVSLYEMNVDRSSGSDTYNADTQTSGAQCKAVGLGRRPKAKEDGGLPCRSFHKLAQAALGGDLQEM